MDFSPELRLTLALLSSDPERRSRENVEGIVRGGMKWSAFVDLVVIRHRVGPIAWQRLQQVPGLKIPDPVRTALDAHSRQNVCEYLEHKAEAIRIGRAMAVAGIRPLLMKGLSLTERHYERPALRHIHDLDLLVEPGEMEVSDGVLRGLGYKETTAPRSPLQARWLQVAQHHVAYHNADLDTYAEVHWRTLGTRHLLEPQFWTALTYHYHETFASTCSRRLQS